jgi:hypothetical protein
VDTPVSGFDIIIPIQNLVATVHYPFSITKCCSNIDRSCSLWKFFSYI